MLHFGVYAISNSFCPSRTSFSTYVASSASLRTKAQGEWGTWINQPSVNIWQSYKQERGCLMHFARRRLAYTLKDEESARDNHVLGFNFAKYSPI